MVLEMKARDYHLKHDIEVGYESRADTRDDMEIFIS
jgi:putative transposon-encoded protein